MIGQEVSDRIDGWVLQCRMGDPEEADYGNGMPDSYCLASAERGYVAAGRAHWSTTQELLDERNKHNSRKEDWQIVEPIYQALDGTTQFHVRMYYFFQRPVPVPRQMQESINTFRGKVANEGRQ